MIFLYNLLFGIAFLFAYPFFLWQAFSKKKRLPPLKERLGWPVPRLKAPVIWIHAVSVGEVKAASALAKKIKEKGFSLLITTTTVTGQEEAKRSIPQADAIRFLPLDLFFAIDRWVSSLRPQWLILIEGDFWPQLLYAVKNHGGKIALVSGRLSETSHRRWKKISFLAKWLFRPIDLFLMQSDEQARRLEPFIEDLSKLHITGNLKMDAAPASIDEQALAPFFSTTSPSIVIASTHHPEEKELLAALMPLGITLFIAPRHPERFDQVTSFLQSEKIPFIRWTNIHQKTGLEKVILIDAMGKLPIFYHFCSLAIVAGSFSSLVGGHNVLEPCLYGTPVFFGPHTDKQQELVRYVLQAGAGKQINICDLATEVARFLKNPLPIRKAAETLSKTSGQALTKSLSLLFRDC